MGGDYQLEIEIGVPSMMNDAGVVNLISGAAQDLLGPEHVLQPVLELGAEDFGCFTERIPGAMFVLGCQIRARPASCIIRSSISMRAAEDRYGDLR